uniref:major tail protein n=1 Tax=Clostridioides difficile TaxID=1496 RepID=UPI002ED02388
MLFGGENMSGGYALASTQNMPNLALLFEQEKRDGGKILNVLYNVQFNPSGLNAKTTEDKKEKSLQELEFNCYPGFDDKGYFFYSLDT